MNSMINTNALISRRMFFAGTGAVSISIATAAAISIAKADEASQRATAPAASQTKGADDWLGALALQAATYAAPIVAMYNLRDTTSVGSHAKVAPNEIWRISDIAN